MEITTLPRNTIRTEISVEEALELIQKLSGAVNHVLRYNMPSAAISSPAYVYEFDDGQPRPGIHNIIVLGGK